MQIPMKHRQHNDRSEASPKLTVRLTRAICEREKARSDHNVPQASQGHP